MNERERLIGMLDDYMGNVFLKNDGLADYLLKSGMIVPPVKIGAKVFLTRKDTNKIMEGEITSIKKTECSEGDMVIFLIDDNRYTHISFEKFGKIVFLTKEEAEQALKGVHKDE